MEISVVRNGYLVKNFKFGADEKQVELLTNRVLSTSRGRQIVVILLAVGLIALDVFLNMQAIPCANLDKLDLLGSKLLGMAQRFGKWIFLIMAVINVIKDAMEGANKDAITKTVVKYLIAYGCMYALPWLFELIEGSF